MSLAKQARAVERDIFGALIGALVAVALSRMILLAADLSFYALVSILLIGVWSGVFVAHVATNQSASAITSLRTFAITFQSVGLRIMLWLLGIAAVLGVLAVLTGSYHVVGRVATTAAVTGIAAGLLFPCLRMLDAERKWRGGVLGTVSVFASYFFVVPSIWEFGNRVDESAVAAFVVMIMLPVGVFAMYLTHQRRTRLAGWVAAVLYALAPVLFLFAVWDDQWRQADKFVGSGLALLGFGSFAIGSLINALTGDRRFWRWIGVAASALVTVLFIREIWNRFYIDDTLIVAVASVAAVVMHANLALLVPLNGTQAWWRVGTIASAIVTAIALDIEMFQSGSVLRGYSVIGRVALAAGILTSTGTLALLIFARLNARPGRDVTNSGELTLIRLQCPRCGKQQAIPLRRTCSMCVRVADQRPSRRCGRLVM